MGNAKAPDPPDRLLTPVEAGSLLALHANTVTRMLRSGEIQDGLRVGERWRVHESTVRRYVRDQQARIRRMQVG